MVLENTVPTKVDGVSDGANVDQLLVRAYDKDGKYLEGITFETEKLADLHYSVKGKLVRNYDYKVVFFAQKQNTYSFSGTNGNEVVFAYSGDANNDNLDAFYAVKDVKLNPDDVAPMSVSVTLKRPFAQVNVGSVKADYDAAKATGIIPADASSLTSVLELQGIPNTLNVLTGEVSGSTTTTFAPAARPSGTLTVAGKTDVEYIAMAYVLAGTGDGQLINKIVLTVNGVNDYTLTRNFLQVPYKQNYRTNLSGSLFTGDVSFDVVVGPGFENTTDKTIDAELPAPVVTPNTVITPNAAGKVESTVGTTIDFGVSVDKEQSVSYSSSDETVGTITNVGIFTPLKAGETDITISIAEKIVTKAEIDKSKSSAAWVKTYHVIVAAAPVTSYAITKSAVSNGTLVVKIDDAEVTEAAEGATVTVVATPLEGYQLATLTYTPAEGEAVDIKTTKFFTMPAKAVAVNATFEVIPPDEYAITVTQPGNGNVIAASAESAEENTEIILSVTTTATGYDLTSWTVTTASSANVTVTDNKFSMPAEAVTVTATFSKINYTITKNDVENGSITVSSETANYGDEITLDATPADGYSFGAWDVKQGETVITVTDNKFTMPAGNVTVGATFTQNAPTKYVVIVDDTVNGTVTADKEEAAVGETVTLTVAPAEYYELDVLTVENENNQAVAVTNNQFAMPEGGVTVTATFKKLKYAVNISTMTNGTVTVDETPAEWGAAVLLTVTPESGYQLVENSLTVTSGVTDLTDMNGGEWGFTMPKNDVTVSAEFESTTVPTPSTYTVTLTGTPDANGNSFSASKTTDVAENEEITLSATPAAGYVFDSWSVKDSGNETITVTNNKFNMPAKNVTVTASFRASKYVKVTSITSGKKYLLIADGHVLTGEISTTSTKYGLKEDIEVPAEGITATSTINAYQVVITNEGNSQFSLKHSNSYLSWSSGNSLTKSDSISDNP